MKRGWGIALFCICFCALLLVCALCWGWLWTEGSVFQIALALLLWFCIGWALCLLLRPRRARMTP